MASEDSKDSSNFCELEWSEELSQEQQLYEMTAEEWRVFHQQEIQKMREQLAKIVTEMPKQHENIHTSRGKLLATIVHLYHKMLQTLITCWLVIGRLFISRQSTSIPLEYASDSNNKQLVQTIWEKNEEKEEEEEEEKEEEEDSQQRLLEYNDQPYDEEEYSNNEDYNSDEDYSSGEDSSSDEDYSSHEDYSSDEDYSSNEECTNDEECSDEDWGSENYNSEDCDSENYLNTNKVCTYKNHDSIEDHHTEEHYSKKHYKEDYSYKNNCSKDHSSAPYHSAVFSSIITNFSYIVIFILIQIIWMWFIFSNKDKIKKFLLFILNIPIPFIIIDCN